MVTEWTITTARPRGQSYRPKYSRCRSTSSTSRRRAAIVVSSAVKPAPLNSSIRGRTAQSLSGRVLEAPASGKFLEMRTVDPAVHGVRRGLPYLSLQPQSIEFGEVILASLTKHGSEFTMHSFCLLVRSYDARLEGISSFAALCPGKNVRRMQP